MHYLWKHINTIIGSYNGSMPLSVFLKNYYRQYPILGSRDRKILSNMAYSWYRCSKGFSHTYLAGDLQAMIKNCLELCQHQYPWMDNIPVVDDFSIENLFPYHIDLSEGISRFQWLQSMVSQPALFIRVVRNMSRVLEALEKGNVVFSRIGGACLSLPNVTNLDKLLHPKDFVIQDASSQETGKYLHPIKNETWYDCCAGAGGKSLMLMGKESGVKLTVSDTRKSILSNLQERFQQYQYPIPNIINADASNREQLKAALGDRKFEHIICDVPCSGSGTWGRTPEQMYFFDPAFLEKINSTQKSIATNVLKYLAPGGKLYYITCSAFRQENEDVVSLLLQQGRVALQSSELINGIAQRADSMYIAVIVNY